MGWLDEQLKERKMADDQYFQEAFSSLASVVAETAGGGKKDPPSTQLKSAMGEILSYFHLDLQEIPKNIEDTNEQLEYLLRPCGVMRRRVKLSGQWYKDSIGPLLCNTVSGGFVAVMPKKTSGYQYFDANAGEMVSLNAKTVGKLSEDAVCFYRPLPQKPIGIVDLLKFMVATCSVFDFVFLVVVTFLATLVALLLPYANDQLFGVVAPTGESALLLSIGIFMVGVLISSTLLSVVKELITTKIQTKLDIAVGAAAMMRILSLPADFFKQYSAGELSSRMQNINELSKALVSAILGSGLTGLFSLVYIAQIAVYAPSLVWVVLVVNISSLLVSFVSVAAQMKRSKRQREVKSKLEGMVFALFSGVQKIKLAGAEKRAFSRWAHVYKDAADLQYAPPFWFRFLPVFATSIRFAGMILVYYIAVTSQMEVSDFMAFNASYSMFKGAVASLSGIVATVAGIRPILEMIEPILKEAPEMAAGKNTVTTLSGHIDANRISFRYKEDMPLVLDDISLNIKAGQYVAIVGATGCGKSTLLRLLLGFEKPLKGAVYYDGHDISTLNLRSLRRNIGVVMQTGKLFQGDIYSNIVITNPALTLEKAWEAAELAGIAEDIRAFPMGMNTVISEGSGGISGGQRQRLMIARAIAPKPKILMFDEATSALDNITQKKISVSLNSLKCTRIVVAHRLSTIRECDRIIVLENGKITEDGTYEELLCKNGHFAELVKRQRLDDDSYVVERSLF